MLTGTLASVATFDLQGNPPEPKDEEVQIIDAPSITVYMKVGSEQLATADFQTFCILQQQLACLLTLQNTSLAEAGLDTILYSVK